MIPGKLPCFEETATIQALMIVSFKQRVIAKGWISPAGKKPFTATGNDTGEFDNRSISMPSVIAAMDPVNNISQAPVNQLS